MGTAKTQIVLDADIIIHFSKAGKIQLLPEIFPEYDFVLLDKKKPDRDNSSDRAFLFFFTGEDLLR